MTKNITNLMVILGACFALTYIGNPLVSLVSYIWTFATSNFLMLFGVGIGYMLITNKGNKTETK